LQAGCASHHKQQAKTTWLGSGVIFFYSYSSQSGSVGAQTLLNIMYATYITFSSIIPQFYLIAVPVLTVVVAALLLCVWKNKKLLNAKHVA